MTHTEVTAACYNVCRHLALLRTASIDECNVAHVDQINERLQINGQPLPECRVTGTH